MILATYIFHKCVSISQSVPLSDAMVGKYMLCILDSKILNYLFIQKEKKVDSLEQHLLKKTLRNINI